MSLFLLLLQFFVNANQTLPLSRFLPKPPIAKSPGAGGKSGEGLGFRVWRSLLQPQNGRVYELMLRR